MTETAPINTTLLQKAQFSPIVLASAAAFLAMTVLSFATASGSSQGIFYLLGHVSFGLTFLAFWQHSLLRLRLLSIASLIIGLVYNTYVHMNMPAGQHLWPVLIWMMVFLGVHAVRTWGDFSALLERDVEPVQRAIQVAAFPKMRSADWAALSAIATTKTYAQGDTIIHMGAATDSLMVLAVGSAVEVTPDKEHVHRSVGTMWGELTWAMGAEAFNESPCTVSVDSAHATVLQIPYAALSDLTEQNQRLAHALLDGIIRDQARKHSRLRLDFPVLADPGPYPTVPAA